MLVTFHSDAWSSITMMGDVAVQLLKMSGHSGAVPSAIRGPDVPVALQKLKASLASESARAHPVPADADEGERPVGLGQRAYPLLQLLSAAASKGADVTWEKGAASH